MIIKLFLISSLFLKLAFAGTIDFNLQHNPVVLRNLLSPVWEKIPYKFKWRSDNFSEALDNSINGKLEKAEITLGPKGQPLAEIIFEKNQWIQLNWDLTQASSDLLIKIRFKFLRLGIQVTRDEYFIVNASEIEDAFTQAKLQYTHSQLQLSHLANHNFKFKKMKIKARDGVGEVLQWIFNYVFSEDEVHRYIKKLVNNKLANWMEDQELLSEITKTLNHEMNQPISFEPFLFSLSGFSHNTNELSLKLSSQLNTDHMKVHECAREIPLLNTKSDIGIEHNLIEEMINALTLYAAEDNEPLLCAGHKEEGTFIKTRVWGRELNLQYWLKPLALPTFDYKAAENKITLDLQMALKIESNNYPLVWTVNDKIIFHMKLQFEINHGPSGLTLTLSDAQIPHYQGKLKIKFARFLPSIQLPSKWIFKKIIPKVTQFLKQELNSVVLIPQEIQLNPNLILSLTAYQMEDTLHRIWFEALD
jgi:hypothetical protein